MIHREFKEMVASDIGGVVFARYLNISQKELLDNLIILEYGDLPDSKKFCLTDITDPVCERSYDQLTGTLKFKLPRPKDINEDEYSFNIIILLKDPSISEVSEPDNYLGVLAWDNTITSEDTFEKLSISYRLDRTIKESSSSISINVAFINHDDAESKVLRVDYQPWNTHTNLNLSYLGSSVPNVSWAWNKNFEQISSRSYTYGNSDPDICLNNAVIDSNSIPENISRDNKISQISRFGFSFKCIPDDYSIKNSKLMVNPKFGVGFYNPSTGKVSTCKSSGDYFLSPLPDALESRQYEVYQYGKNATIFYDVENYSVYVSTYRPNESVKWSNCWRVGGTNTVAKIFIPSYFDIFPFAFINNNGQWRVCFVSAFEDNSNILLDRPDAETLSNAKVDDECYVSSGSILADAFFANPNYLNSFIGLIATGYTNTTENANYRDRIKSYIWAQLYCSYQTLKQAIRYNSNQDTIKIKDTGILFSTFFIPYSQEFGIHRQGYNNQKNSSNALNIPNLVDIDNFIVKIVEDNTEYLASLVSSTRSIEMSGIENIQMKHGIIVGYKISENKYVQLQ